MSCLIKEYSTLLKLVGRNSAIDFSNRVQPSQEMCFFDLRTVGKSAEGRHNRSALDKINVCLRYSKYMVGCSVVD